MKLKCYACGETFYDNNVCCPACRQCEAVMPLDDELKKEVEVEVWQV